MSQIECGNCGEPRNITDERVEACDECGDEAYDISQPIMHRSLRYERISHPASFIEKALSEAWEKENERKHSVNWGLGRLELLMQQNGFHTPGSLAISSKVKFEPISQRDATVAATVIQWLGTNIGFNFLEEALKQCGYVIRKKEREK